MARSNYTMKTLRQDLAAQTVARKDMQGEMELLRRALQRQRDETENLRKLYSDEMGKRVEAQDEVRRIRIEAELEAKAKARAEEEARTGVIDMSPPACFCGVCLEEAALKLGPSWTYEVNVAPRLQAMARKILRTYAAAHQDNPFAPWVNLFVAQSYGTSGWSVSANGKMVRSKGVD